jgi:peptidoglycan/LPS O-acetylase OafA/YrhL
MKFLKEAFTDAGNIMLAMLMLVGILVVGIVQVLITYQLFEWFTGEGMGGWGGALYFIVGGMVLREVDPPFLKELALVIFAWLISLVIALIAAHILPGGGWTGMVIGALFYSTFGVHLLEKGRLRSSSAQVVKGQEEDDYARLKEQLRNSK